MKIIEPYAEIIWMPTNSEALKLIELAGRCCYKSEDKITDTSADGFVKKIIKSGHLSVSEHVNITVRFVVDRGVSHELVRHRLASYSQESTRYANYANDKFDNEITVIRPFFWDEASDEYQFWSYAMKRAENSYLRLVNIGASPQEARSVLPNSLKTEVIMTANIREWRHVFNLRCSKKSHPQMVQVMLPLLDKFYDHFPTFFHEEYTRFRIKQE